MELNAEERLTVLKEAGGVLYSEEDLVIYPVFRSMKDALRFQELSEEEQQEAMKGAEVIGAAGKYGAENLVRVVIDDGTMDPPLGPEDSILVAFRVPVENGDPAMVRIGSSGSELMVRHIEYRDDGFIDLYPLNHEYPGETVESENVQILGIAASVDRALI